MVSLFSTAQGHLQELRGVQRELAAARDPVEIISAVQGAVASMAEEFRARLNTLLGRGSTLEEARQAALEVFGEFHAAQEAQGGPSVEEERQDALRQLQEIAKELRDLESSSDEQLTAYYFRIRDFIDHREDDPPLVLHGDPQLVRQSLLTFIEARLASGQAGKSWV